MADRPSVPELIRRHFRNLVAGDTEAITPLVHEDFVQEWPQSGERVRGKAACLNVVRNYPGGPPHFELGPITGEGDHWVVEATSRYPDGTDDHTVAIIELRDRLLAREVDHFGPTYPAPEWRREWVEPITDRGKGPASCPPRSLAAAGPGANAMASTRPAGTTSVGWRNGASPTAASMTSVTRQRHSGRVGAR